MSSQKPTNKNEIVEYERKKFKPLPWILVGLLAIALIYFVVPTRKSADELLESLSPGNSSNSRTANDELPTIKLPTPTTSHMAAKIEPVVKFLTRNELQGEFSGVQSGQNLRQNFRITHVYVNGIDYQTTETGNIETTTADWKSTVNVLYGFDVGDATQSIEPASETGSDAKLVVKQNVKLNFWYPLESNGLRSISPVQQSIELVKVHNAIGIVEYQPSKEAHDLVRTAVNEIALQAACSSGEIAAAKEDTKKAVLESWKAALGEDEFQKYEFVIEIESIDCN